MLKSQNKGELEVQLCWNRLQKPNGGSRKGISPRKKNKKKKKEHYNSASGFSKIRKNVGFMVGEKKRRDHRAALGLEKGSQAKRGQQRHLT